MLNYLWGYMILMGVGFAFITGQINLLSDTIIASSGDAVALAITMLGIMSMWTGLMEVAKQAGLISKLTRLLRPVLHFLFPKLSETDPAYEPISMNIIANLLGLGWAATPMGLKAMKALARHSDHKHATDEMCTFLIINISSLQLIPVNVIAYRAQFLSKAPASIILPGLITTTVSTLVAIIFCRIMTRRT